MLYEPHAHINIESYCKLKERMVINIRIYKKPITGIPEKDLESGIRQKLRKIANALTRDDFPNTKDSNYYEFPNGMKMCWGEFSATTGTNKSATGIVNFPITFNSVIYVDYTVSTGNTAITQDRRFNGINNTGFTYFINNSTAGYTNTYKYIAFGY